MKKLILILLAVLLLKKIAQAEEYKQYPVWVRQFYELRLGVKGE